MKIFLIFVIYLFTHSLYGIKKNTPYITISLPHKGVINSIKRYPIKKIPIYMRKKNIILKGKVVKYPFIKEYPVKKSKDISFPQYLENTLPAKYTQKKETKKYKWQDYFKGEMKTLGFFGAKVHTEAKKFNQKARQYSTEKNKNEKPFAYFSTTPDQYDLQKRVNRWTHESGRKNELNIILNYFLETLTTAYEKGGEQEYEEAYKHLKKKYRAPKMMEPDYGMYKYGEDKKEIREMFEKQRTTNQEIEALIEEAQKLFDKEQEAKNTQTWVTILKSAQDKQGLEGLETRYKNLLKEFAPGPLSEKYHDMIIDRSGAEEEKSKKRENITKAYLFLKNNQVKL